VSQVLTAVQQAATRSLYSLVSDALANVEMTVPSLGRGKMDVLASDANKEIENLEH